MTIRATGTARSDRRGALPRLGAAVRGAVGAAARRAGRRDRAVPRDAAPGVTVERASRCYAVVVLAALLFCIGVYGVLARRNAILVLMSVELMLNAVNLNLVAFDVWLRDALHSGQVAHAVRHHDRRRRDRPRPGDRAAGLPQPRARSSIDELRESRARTCRPTRRCADDGDRRRAARRRTVRSLLSRRCFSVAVGGRGSWRRSSVGGTARRVGDVRAAASSSSRGRRRAGRRRRAARAVPTGVVDITLATAGRRASRRWSLMVVRRRAARAGLLRRPTCRRGPALLRRTPRWSRCSPPRCCWSSSPAT